MNIVWIFNYFILIEQYWDECNKMKSRLFGMLDEMCEEERQKMVRYLKC